MSCKFRGDTTRQICSLKASNWGIKIKIAKLHGYYDFKKTYIAFLMGSADFFFINT